MLDIKTGMVLWSAESLTAAAVLLTMWLHDRSARAFLTWAIGFALSGTGIALIGMRGSIPDFLSIEIANTLALTGCSLWVIGLFQFENRPFRLRAILPPAIWVVGMLLPDIRDSFSARVVLYNCASAIGYLLLASILLGHQTGKSPSKRYLGIVFAIQVLVCIGVAAYMLIVGALDMQAIAIAPIPLFSGALSFVLSILLGTRMYMEKSEQRLRLLASTDPLTGALNRRGLFEHFETGRATRKTDGHSVAMILFDLDHFKKINDRYGHQAGDSVLMAFAAHARNSTPSKGVFGRIGGEEFAIIVDVRDQDEAIAIGEQIRTDFSSSPIDLPSGSIWATASCGIATMPASTATVDQLMSTSDRALYAAKDAGRNRTSVELAGTVWIAGGALHSPMSSDAAANQAGARRRLATSLRL